MFDRFFGFIITVAILGELKTTISADGQLAQVQSTQNANVGIFAGADGVKYKALRAVD